MVDKKKTKRKNVTQDSELDLDRQVCIIHCIAAKMSLKKSLEYVKEHGHRIEKSKFYIIRNMIIERRAKFGHKLAAGGLFEQHMIRIENLEVIEREFWALFHKEQNPLKQAIILEKIQNIQPFISSAYDYIKEIMLEQAKLEGTTYAQEPQPGVIKKVVPALEA